METIIPIAAVPMIDIVSVKSMIAIKSVIMIIPMPVPILRHRGKSSQSQKTCCQQKRRYFTHDISINQGGHRKIIGKEYGDIMGTVIPAFTGMTINESDP